MTSPESRRFPAEVRSPDSLLEDADWEYEENTDALLSSRLNVIKEAAADNGIALNEQTRLLEIGSGRGEMLAFLHNNNIPAIGVDARPNGEHNSLTIAARIEILPFEDNSFDIIASMQAFDPGAYDQDQELMLKEIARVLRPGGIFVAQQEEMDPDILAEIEKLKQVRDSEEHGARVFVKV